MKTLLLITTITIGVVYPFTEKYSFMIKYLLMLMLFFSFLSMGVRKEHFHISHLKILVLNIITPIIAYLIIFKFNAELARVVFITAIAPTAIASPIIIRLLNREMEYTVVSIILTNFLIAFLLPFLLPALTNSFSKLTFLDVMVPVLTVFLIPLLLSEIVKRGSSKIFANLKKLNKYVFYILVVNINLGTSKASYYIREEMSFYDPIIYQIAIASLILCVFNFYAGKKISSPGYQIESGQSLGQKNNGFSVWVALTFISPIAVLGPVFYILYQNLYISWQLQNHSRKKV